MSKRTIIETDDVARNAVKLGDCDLCPYADTDYGFCTIAIEEYRPCRMEDETE